jgi:hypothetical protein
MVRRLLAVLLAVGVISVVAVRLVREPSTSRDWTPQQRLLPSVAVRGPIVEIRNVRDFVSRSQTDFDERYLDRSYDLRQLRSADYVLSRFGGVPGLAHAFLSFRFGDEYVCISVEARKEKGETYSPFRGLLHAYELMYVVGSERDLIGVRTHVWKERVTLYPVSATPEKLQQVFLDMVLRADRLARRPEFYDTLTNSCNSNIVRHVNSITPGRIAFDLRTILPGFADRVAHEEGLIDSTLPLEELREAYRIDDEAAGLPLDDNFSRAIRVNLPAR